MGATNISQLCIAALPEQLPSGVTEGRNVHYVAYNNRHLAALITGFDPEKATVDLVVFTNMRNVNGDQSGGVQFHFNVHFDEETKAPGTCHFIEWVAHNLSLAALR